MKLALLVANRGFFPSSVIDSAYAEMKSAFAKAEVECLTFEEGKPNTMRSNLPPTEISITNFLPNIAENMTVL